MNRYIRLKNNVVVSVRYGSEIVAGEIASDEGQLGQIIQNDGSFVDPEPDKIEYEGESNPIIDKLNLLIQMQLEKEGIL